MLYVKYSYERDYKKNASLKQPIQGMLKWTEQQLDKSISLKSNQISQ